MICHGRLSKYSPSIFYSNAGLNGHPCLPMDGHPCLPMDGHPSLPMDGHPCLPMDDHPCLPNPYGEANLT